MQTEICNFVNRCLIRANVIILGKKGIRSFVVVADSLYMPRLVTRTPRNQCLNEGEARRSVNNCQQARSHARTLSACDFDLKKGTKFSSTLAFRSCVIVNSIIAWSTFNHSSLDFFKFSPRRFAFSSIDRPRTIINWSGEPFPIFRPSWNLGPRRVSRIDTRKDD